MSRTLMPHDDRVEARVSVLPRQVRGGLLSPTTAATLTIRAAHDQGN